MALRTLIDRNDPLLRSKAYPVWIGPTSEFYVQLTLDDLNYSMKVHKGIGLAAPQVGIPVRMFVLCLKDMDKPIEFVNPVIIEQSFIANIALEGCLSLPGKTFKVSRSDRVVITALDRNLKEFELAANGLLARCIQHEMDHLEGILISDRANGKQTPKFQSTQVPANSPRLHS